MGNDGGGAHTQIISPSARTGFGVPSTGGDGTSTALTVASAVQKARTAAAATAATTIPKGTPDWLFFFFDEGPGAGAGTVGTSSSSFCFRAGRAQRSSRFVAQLLAATTRGSSVDQGVARRIALRQVNACAPRFWSGGKGSEFLTPQRAFVCRGIHHGECRSGHDKRYASHEITAIGLTL